VFGRPSSLAQILQGEGRAQGQTCRGERESQRFERISTENGQMEACRESENVVFRNINVWLVGRAAHRQSDGDGRKFAHRKPQRERTDEKRP
jgi:hypothetical protein